MDWTDEAEAEVGTCDHCGYERTVAMKVDPYMRELYPDEATSSRWCYECYFARSMDI